MVSWIIYILVTFILFFILFIAYQGINRGLEAKNINNKNHREFYDENKIQAGKKSVADELTKLNKLYNDGVLNKEQFEAAKKKILG
tara:strand:+ start:192 stop:449 length:258 start_codon:yes stop_codon:yes gene_type:complete